MEMELVIEDRQYLKRSIHLSLSVRYWSSKICYHTVWHILIQSYTLISQENLRNNTDASGRRHLVYYRQRDLQSLFKVCALLEKIDLSPKILIAIIVLGVTLTSQVLFWNLDSIPSMTPNQFDFCQCCLSGILSWWEIRFLVWPHSPKLIH